MLKSGDFLRAKRKIDGQWVVGIYFVFPMEIGICHTWAAFYPEDDIDPKTIVPFPEHKERKIEDQRKSVFIQN